MFTTWLIRYCRGQLHPFTAPTSRLAMQDKQNGIWWGRDWATDDRSLTTRPETGGGLWNSSTHTLVFGSNMLNHFALPAFERRMLYLIGKSWRGSSITARVWVALGNVTSIEANESLESKQH